MKKKHWKVSVFDQTSETIKDNTLYTTDTEVYLVFELIDKNFRPDSATVTIYNIYGTATISESVEIVDGIVNYEIPEDAIGHQGGWRTQVVFTKDNEDYTTKVIEFDVDGHLLDNKKPTIVYIENWNSFIKHGEGLIDDWEQLEKIRQANERKRESAESVRRNTFETNETGRQTNELVREENELARESAESVRVANESERISKDSERDSRIETLTRELQSFGLVEKYVHEGNLEVDITSIDFDNNTFIKENHGLVDGDKVFPFLNKGVVEALKQYLPNGIEFIKDIYKDGYTVANATTDTFQLSDGSSVLSLSEKETLDLTKWHFEKLTNQMLGFTGLQDKRYRIIIKGQFMGNLSGYWFGVTINNESVFSSPLTGGGATYMIHFVTSVNLLFDTNNTLSVNGFMNTSYQNDTSNDSTFVENIRVENKMIGVADNIDIQSIGFLNSGSWVSCYPANGSIMEVYKS